MNSMLSAQPSPTSVHMALVGCGMWGRNIARNLSEMGLLRFVCDSNTENATRFASEFNAQTGTLDQILADEEISALVITSPATTHCKIACDALDAGKHVYIEKPMAMSLDEAGLIEMAAKQAKKQVMIGHLIRYHPAFQRLQQLVEQGAVGEIYHLQANRLAMGRIRKSESVLMDLCPHDLSLILAMMKQQPSHLICSGVSHITAGIADHVTTSMRFSDGITAQMQTSWIHPTKEHKFTVTGSKGSIVFDDTQGWDQKLCLYQDSFITEHEMVSINRMPAQYIAIEPSEPLRLEMQAFAKSCTTNSPAPTDLTEGLAVQKTLQTMIDHYQDISA